MLFPENHESDGEQAKFRSNSLSGGERHRLFLRRDENYKDFTLVSGADFREDGRGFSLLDLDGDGFLDMGITSPNYPRFRIIRNRIGDLESKPHHYVRVSLVGGQTDTTPSTEWSPRDAYGSTLLVTTGDVRRKFQLSLGEGLSIQNAKWLHIGLGDTEQVDRIEVSWPSGKQTVVENITADQHITIYENPEQQPPGQ